MQKTLFEQNYDLKNHAQDPLKASADGSIVKTLLRMTLPHHRLKASEAGSIVCTIAAAKVCTILQ